MSMILHQEVVATTAVKEMAAGTDPDSTDAAVAPEEVYRPPPQTYPGCFGLPYQDHNYGAPPPPTPPQSPTPCKINGHVEIDVSTITVISKDAVVDDSITRCICEFQHDDGYMICCDKCSVWQHIDCMGIDRNYIPESYYCERCEFRDVDKEKARQLQARKREEMSDTSATDTDPEEALNQLRALVEKSKKGKKYGKQKQERKRRVKQREKKDPSKTTKKQNNKETSKKPPRTKAARKVHTTVENDTTKDSWNSSLKPGVQTFEKVQKNLYSSAVQEILSKMKINGQNTCEESRASELLVQLCQVVNVHRNKKGLQATEKLTDGQAIIEYLGKVLLKEECDGDFSKRLHPFTLYYSKFEDIDLCIDASSCGNDARFIRRSCSPNAEVRHVLERGHINFFIYSIKEITKGAEITISFDFNQENGVLYTECACSRNNCPLVKPRRNKSVNRSRRKSKAQPQPKTQPQTPQPLTPQPQHQPEEECGSYSETSSSTDKVLSAALAEVAQPAAILTSPIAKTPSPTPPPPLPPPPVSKSPPAAEPHPEFQPLSSSDEVTNPDVDTLSEEPSEEPPKKMTREERKMEAIMKAFEKLEKREERRKEALARIENARKSQEKSQEKIQEKETAEEKPEITETKPEIPPSPKPQPQKGKKKKGHGITHRRRSRVNSGSSEATLSQDENSNAGSTQTSIQTPQPQLPPENNNSNSSGFKFLKTKKLLMNEWLSEKVQDGKPVPTKTEPLEVSVDETMFVTCLHSPRSSMEHLRRMSHNSGGIAGKIPVGGDSNAGSAKKRWLRQAMHETGPGDSGKDSPVPVCESSSPNPMVSIPSPGASPPADFVTPLKKRRLARESLSLDQPPSSSPSTQSPFLSQTMSLDLPGSTGYALHLEELENKNGYKPNCPLLTSVTTDDLQIDRLKKTSGAESAQSFDGGNHRDSFESDLSDANRYTTDSLKDVSDTEEVTNSECLDESSNRTTAESAGPCDLEDEETLDAAETIEQQKTLESTLNGSAKLENNLLNGNKECGDSKFEEGEIVEDMEDEMTGSDPVQQDETENETSHCTVATNMSDSFEKKVGVLQEQIDSSTTVDTGSTSQHECKLKLKKSDGYESQTDLCQDMIPCDSQNRQTDFEDSSDQYKVSGISINKPETVDSSLEECDISKTSSDVSSLSMDQSQVVDSTCVDEDQALDESKQSQNQSDHVRIAELSEPQLPLPCRDKEKTCEEPCMQDCESVHVEPAESLNGGKLSNVCLLSGNENLLESTSMHEESIEVCQSVINSDHGVGNLNNTTLLDTSQIAPTKKKVSLLEYRKRLKEKVRDSTASTPLKALTSVSTPLTPDRMPTLAPLPLFEQISPAKENDKLDFKGTPDHLLSGKDKKCDEIKWQEKPMSLTERLRQEFGLEESDEEENKPDGPAEAHLIPRHPVPYAQPPVQPVMPPPHHARVLVNQTAMAENRICPLMSIQTFQHRFQVTQPQLQLSQASLPPLSSRHSSPRPCLGSGVQQAPTAAQHHTQFSFQGGTSNGSHHLQPAVSQPVQFTHQPTTPAYTHTIQSQHQNFPIQPHGGSSGYTVRQPLLAAGQGTFNPYGSPQPTSAPPNQPQQFSGAPQPPQQPPPPPPPPQQFPVNPPSQLQSPPAKNFFTRPTKYTQPQGFLK